MRFLSACARRSAASPRWVMMVAILILATSAILASQLRVSTDISALMPEHSRLSGSLLQALDDFGTSDRLLLVIESTDQSDQNRIGIRRHLRELAGRVAAGMEGTGLFRSVAYRVTPEQQQFFEDLYSRYPLHYHSEESLQGLKDKLTPEEMDRRMKDLSRNIRVSPFGASIQRQMLRDPLGFRGDHQEGYTHENLTGFKLDLTDGYFFSADSSLILIVARPASPSQDTDFDALLIDKLEKMLMELGGGEGFLPDYSISMDQEFEARLLGPYVETLYGSRAAQKELLPSIILTALGLLILFTAVYRSGRMLLVLFFPLLTGILMASAAASVFAGHLTMMTVGFAAMLAGLGIDFEIHLVERFGQEAVGSKNPVHAIATAFATTGKGVLAGALTTAAIFGLIATSDFAALREFGWIIGLGILLTMIAIFVLLPPLMMLFPWSPRTDRPAANRAWAAWVVSHYRLVTLVGLALTIVLGYSASRLDLESNIYELGPLNETYEQEKDRVLNVAGGSTNVLMLVAQRRDLQEILELSERITARLESLKASDEIDSFESLSSLLLSNKAQSRTIREAQSWGLDTAMQAFRGSLAEAGFRSAPFEPFIDNLLGYQSDAGKIIHFEDLQATPAEDMLGRYLVKDEDGWKSVTYVYPHNGSWEDRVPERFIESLEGQGEHVTLTGIVPVFNEIASLVRQEFLRLTLAALVIVLVISMLFFKRPLLSIMSAVPAIFGLIWTLGVMKFLGIELNLVTMLVAPLIVGLGIDDALHVLNRHQENPARMADTMAAVAPAILMTTITTIIGFGSLALAELPSLQSLGMTVSIGMLCCAATSLLLLPALLTVFEKRS